jgi:hypothetical protein
MILLTPERIQGRAAPENQGPKRGFGMDGARIEALRMGELSQFVDLSVKLTAKLANFLRYSRM